MSDKLSELLPCPFCGGRASSSQQTTGGRWAAYCLNCEAMVDGEFSEPDAIAAWNRRASPAPAIPAALTAEQRKSIKWAMRATSNLATREALGALLKAAPAISESEDARDAARYRWLRDKHDGDGPAAAVRCLTGPFFNTAIHGERLDAAIDAARKGEKS